jgi:Transposase, Mutator family
MPNITFSAAKINGQERKDIIYQVQAQLQQAVLAAIKPLLTAFLQEEVAAKLNRPKYAPRTVEATPRPLEWVCSNCGCNDANQFTRDGHYQRNLETGWGHLTGLRVPMLECQKCQHDVAVDWTILEKFKRFWLDLDQKVLFGTGLCQSLRQMSQEWSSVLGASVGLRTINERINKIQTLIEVERKKPLAQTSVPSVIQLDGIWLSLQTQTGDEASLKVDRRGRLRHKRTGKRMVVLVALGLHSDPSGRREIVDWELAESESEEAWTKLLQRLWERGARAENGVRVLVRDGGSGLGEAISYVYGTSVADQRCIFHKLKNVSDACSPELSAETKKELMGQAKGIYEAKSADAARLLLAKWSEKWQVVAPKAVASLGREFEATLAYYSLEEAVGKLARTTSLLERTNRELRRKFRQVGVWGSEKGVGAGVFLQVARLNTWWAKGSWWETSQNLFFELFDQPNP